MILSIKGVCIIFMKKEWILKESDIKEKSLIKRLLNSRGITDEQEIKNFLHPLEAPLTSPEVFVDMPKATQRIVNAIERKESIVIYGDFDADGVTSTSVLYKTLQYLGADVHYFIPNRETQGHGFDTSSLVKLMTTIKPRIIISVDCGISDVDAVKFINSFKTIDVIITDHHEAPEILPDAYAIINPKAPNSLDENLSAKQIEHLTYLAGCGVAFKLAQSLLTHYNKTEFIYNILPFVAVGTIADVVPLLGENRYFVAKGLELISLGKHEGLKLLLESAGYDITKGITSEQIAFGIAPRINASGRLDTVDSALKVLISDNNAEIQMAITSLNDLNRVRQKLCSDTFEQADEMLKKEGNKNSAIVLCNPEWHVGIVGIVASKLVEKYYKPTFLMTIKDGVYRCSARSIEGVPLYDVIDANSELLDGFGGHSLAAGLCFSKTSFEEVKKALISTVSEYVSAQELKPFINIDLVLEPDEVTTDLVEELSGLEPFGASNPSPIFQMNDLIIKQKRLMGNDNSHLKLTLEKDGKEFSAIRWSQGDVSLNINDKLDLAFHPQINEYNGNIAVQLIIDDIHSDNLTEEISEAKKYKIYDNRFKTGILKDVNDYLKNTKLNIKVFAESKPVKDSVKSYDEIYSRIFTRESAEECDVVMFFDYPADKQTLEKILSQTQPKALHFMHFEPIIYDENSLIKTFLGMVKFASHNNGGKIELVRCASFLGKSVDIIKDLLNLFEDEKIIKIIEKNESFYKVFYENSQVFEEILNNSKFEEIFEKSCECDMFRQNLLEDDLEQVIYNL